MIQRLKSWLSLYTELLHIYLQSSADRLLVAENQGDSRMQTCFQPFSRSEACLSLTLAEDFAAGALFSPFLVCGKEAESVWKFGIPVYKNLCICQFAVDGANVCVPLADTCVPLEDMCVLQSPLLAGGSLRV